MIHLDCETKSECDLVKCGAWVYSQHPTTEVICLSWAVNDGPIEHWYPGMPGVRLVKGMPASLYMAIMVGHEVESFGPFEIAMWINYFVKRLGWCEILDHQWRDLQAVACYMALPAKLEKLAKALGFPGKDPEGARLITKYSKLHLKTAKRVIPPEDLVKWLRYCDQDVHEQRDISNYLGDLPEREMPRFRLSTEMNIRGLALDRAGIEDAIEIVDKRAEELTLEFRAITGGLNPTQRDKVMAWFAEQGLHLDNMQGDYLEELLDDEETVISAGPVRRALQIRIQINRASTKKLDAMLRSCGSDGRAHFQTRYHGAQTGRPTGTGFQPLNLSRGFEKVEPAQLVRDIAHRDPALLDIIYGDATEAVAKAARHWIVAAPGHRIISGDFVSVEAIVNACLAGEAWKVEAFRRGDPIYCVTACKVHGMDPQIAIDLGDKGFKAKYGELRQDGKVCELAFGYQGALNAWLNFDSSGRHSDEAIIGFVKNWRTEHPMTKKQWRGLEEAAVEAVMFPGREISYRDIGFVVVDDGEFLAMILPNGKHIWYYAPELRTAMPSWHKPFEDEDCAAGTCRCKPHPVVSYYAQKFGQWKRITTYGGKLCENAVQATSREILEYAAEAAKQAGYNIILTVYDEIVAEVRDGFGSMKELADIMREARHPFYKTWPISVDPSEGDRYKK